MHVPPETFRAKPLRVHSFLADVPLHDVWALRLVGSHEPRTIHDLRALWSSDGMAHASRMVRSLFWLRGVLGRWLHWDNPRHEPPASYVSRLTDADRAQSLAPPGSLTKSPFHLIYAFDNETLVQPGLNMLSV